MWKLKLSLLSLRVPVRNLWGYGPFTSIDASDVIDRIASRIIIVYGITGILVAARHAPPWRL